MTCPREQKCWDTFLYGLPCRNRSYMVDNPEKLKEFREVKMPEKLCKTCYLNPDRDDDQDIDRMIEQNGGGRVK